MVVAVAAAGAASCACFDDVVAVEPPSGLDLRLLLPSKMSPDELVVERLEPAVVLAVAGSFKLVPRLASLAGASRGAGAFFLSGASSAEPAVEVVLLAEQLDLLCELGLVGASRCRHETVDTVLQ